MKTIIKRVFLLLAAALAFPQWSQAEITLSAQSVNATPSTTSTTHTATVTAATGDLLIVQVASRDNQAVTGVQDDLSNVFTRAGAASYNSISGYYSEIWYLENATAGSRTVTVTFAGTSRAGINLSAWAGAATSSVLDQNSEANTAGTTTTSHGHGSITTTGAGLILQAYSFGGSPGTRTPETDFTAMTVTDGSGYDRVGFYYRLVTGSTASSGTVTTVNSILSAAKIASFNEAGGGALPTITDAEDEAFYGGELGVTLTGSNFGSTQGAGRVVISPTDDIDNVSAVEQTVTSWSASSIDFTVVRSSLSLNTNLYLFVEENGGNSNAAGYVVQITGDKKIKLLLNSASVGATVDGVVFEAPVSGIVGPEVCEFTGQTVAAGSGADAGKGVLKVVTATFGCNALALGAAPLVYVKNATNFTPIWAASVIAE